MSEENLNNNGKWKSGLDELTSWPGEIMPDKNASFEKLHARLREKRRSRKALWYWTAAASLLFALIISLVFVKDEIHPVAATETDQNQPQKLTDPVNAKPFEKDSVAIIGSVIRKDEEIAVSDKINKAVHKIIPPEIRNEIRLYDTVSSTDLVKENRNNLLQPVDTSSSIVAALPPKKKLKVVHINELGDPVEVSQETVNKKEIRSFQLKLASQEVYSHSPVAFNKVGFTIFKTKSSSN